MIEIIYMHSLYKVDLSKFDNVDPDYAYTSIPELPWLNASMVSNWIGIKINTLNEIVMIESHTGRLFMLKCLID